MLAARRLHAAPSGSTTTRRCRGDSSRPCPHFATSSLTTSHALTHPTPSLLAPVSHSGPGDILGWGTKQSGRQGSLSALCFAQLQKHPVIMEHARAAAANLLVSGGLTLQLKAALVGYGLWVEDAPAVPAGLVERSSRTVGRQ